MSFDLIVPNKHKVKDDEKYGSMKQRRKTLQVKKEKVRLAKREDYDKDDLLDENLLCSRRNSNTNVVGSTFVNDEKEYTSASHNVFPISHLNHRNISPNLRSIEHLHPITSA